MSAPLPFLRGDDPRWDCRGTFEIASASFDEDLAGLGSSPYSGDMGATGVRVPEAATAAIVGGPTAQQNRYLIRLCGVEIPPGSALIIHGLRQLATIRAETDENGEPLVLEREVESPGWRFPDGNISWHLRHQQSLSTRAPHDAAQAPGESTDPNALDASLLYLPPRTPYQAPMLGRPPGVGISDLGTWRDMRFPWRTMGSFEDLNLVVRGGGSVVFYASVFQPDAANREQIWPVSSGLRPEDLFVSDFPTDALYGRVAGALIVELVPCCAEFPKAGHRHVPGSPQ